MTVRFPDDSSAMARALELAQRGVGFVEPNPPVGAVVISADGEFAGEGYHQKFGGPHAEIFALKQAGEEARGGTIYVTLEPCCHEGKTPPCTRAILEAGIKRVVVGTRDPAPHVAGKGIRELRQAGLDVTVGVMGEAAAELIAPFATLFTKHRPFVHAKWAMTLDGKIASRSGHSQWISGPESRRVVHELRGRMDAILVGAGTAKIDNPRLTARPPGPRTPVRVVLDRRAEISPSFQLVQSLEEAPVLVAAGEVADPKKIAELKQAGLEVVSFPEAENGGIALSALMKELASRQFTNVLVEGGGQLLGSFFDAGLIDEVHAFIAPKLVGGQSAPSPLQGTGLSKIPEESQLTNLEIRTLDGDIFIRGRVRRA